MPWPVSATVIVAMVAVDLDGDVHRPAARRVTHRVGQEVREDLVQASGIPDDQHRPGRYHRDRGARRRVQQPTRPCRAPRAVPCERPEDKEELNLSFVEQILCDDVLDYYTDLLSKGSKSKTNKAANEEQLKLFGEVFTKALNSIYKQTNKSFYLKKIYDWNEYCMTEFSYGENAEFEGVEKGAEIDEEIKSLVEAKYEESVYLIKVVKIYQKNKVLLLKPKSLRFWLRSIALKDADEVFSDLIKAGY